MATPAGKTSVTADAISAGTVFGHDTYERLLRQTNLIVLMCASESVCKTAQSQIQFSGTIEERADKNRQTAFEMVDDPRDHWWAYSAGRAIVLALPTAEFTPTQRDALEGFLRGGRRLVLLEHEMADPSFLSAYRDQLLHPPHSMPYPEALRLSNAFQSIRIECKEKWRKICPWML